jgi:hypothetical protein
MQEKAKAIFCILGSSFYDAGSRSLIALTIFGGTLKFLNKACA